MSIRCLPVLLAASLLLLAAPKTTTPTSAVSSKKLDLKGTLYYQRADVERILENKLEQGFIVVELTFTPKIGEDALISYDEFLLLAEKDGQRSQPLTPAQLAGSSMLVISSVPGEAVIASEDRGPTWGGLGGAPRRLPGESPGIGNSVAPDSIESKVTESGDEAKERDRPFLATLKKKCLPETKTSQPVTGLLIFPIDGKHKAKQLELFYKGPLGRLSLRWDKE